MDILRLITLIAQLLSCLGCFHSYSPWNMVSSCWSFSWQLAWISMRGAGGGARGTGMGTVHLLYWGSVSSTERVEGAGKMCVSSLSNKFGIKRVWAVILSYCSWKQHLFSSSLGSVFSRWNQAWDKSIQHVSHTPTHKLHFLPNLKCNRYRVVPIIQVNMVPLPRRLVTIIYNLWIQPRNKAKRKWTETWSVRGNEIAFQFHVPLSSCSFSFLDFFPNLLPQWLTLQLQFPSLACSHVIQ